MPEFETDDALVHYEITGAGPPLLLIAGIASDSASWGPLVPLLADRFRLILVDNRGTGRTVSDEISVGSVVNDCNALLDHLDIAKADVLGHSMGGMIALRLAAGYPQRIRRLIVMATGGRPDPKSQALLEDMVRLFDHGVPQRLWFRLFFHWLFARPFFADPATIETAADAAMAYPFLQPPEMFRRQVDAVRAMPPVDLGAITAPALGLAGDEDLLMPEKVMTAALDGLANLQMRVIPGAGHSLHWDAPEEAAKAIGTFLSV